MFLRRKFVPLYLRALSGIDVSNSSHHDLVGIIKTYSAIHFSHPYKFASQYCNT